MAGKLILALDPAERTEHFIRGDKRHIRQLGSQSIQRGLRHDGGSDQAEFLQFLFAHAFFGDIGKRCQRNAGVIRLGGFTVNQQLHDVRNHTAALCIFQAFGTDQQDRFALRRNKHAGLFKCRPVLCQVTDIGKVGLRAVYKARIKTRFLHVRLKFRDSVEILLFRN